MAIHRNRPGKVVGTRVLTLACAAGLMVLLLAACLSNKNAVAAGLPAPNSGFQTGTVFGYDVYIWDCYQDKRIVVYRESAEMRVGPYMREEAECGGMTPIETKLANERKRTLDPSRFW